SSHAIIAPPAHAPPEHASPVVHASPSSHGVPSAAAAHASIANFPCAIAMGAAPGTSLLWSQSCQMVPPHAFRRVKNGSPCATYAAASPEGAGSFSVVA